MRRCMLICIVLAIFSLSCSLDYEVPEIQDAYIGAGEQAAALEENKKGIEANVTYPLMAATYSSKEGWYGYRIRNTNSFSRVGRLLLLKPTYDIYGPISVTKNTAMRVALRYQYGQDANVYLKWTKPEAAFNPTSDASWDLSSTNGAWMDNDILVAQTKEEYCYIGVRSQTNITEYTLVIFSNNGSSGETIHRQGRFWASPWGTLIVRGKDLAKDAVHTAPELYSISQFCTLTVGPAERGKVQVYIKAGSKPTLTNYDAILTNGESWVYDRDPNGSLTNDIPTNYYYFIKSLDCTTDYTLTLEYHSKIYFTSNLSLPEGTTTPGPVVPPVIQF